MKLQFHSYEKKIKEKIDPISTGNNYDKLSKVNLTKQCNYHYQLRKFHWNLILSRPASPQHSIQFDGQEDIDIKVVDSHYSF